MRLPAPEPDWPASWRTSYEYDTLELVPGEPRREHGYVYSYRRRRAVALTFVRRVAKPPASVVDIGAAQGNFTLSLAELGYRVTWNDLRPELAGYVRLKQRSGEVRYMPGEIFHLPPTEEHDVALATEIIEHVAHPDSFLDTIKGFVKPGGFVVLTTPNGGYFRNRLRRFSECDNPSQFESHQFRPDADGHIFLLHPDELKRLAEQAGFELVELRLFSTSLTHGWLGTRLLLPHIPESAVRAVDGLVSRLPASIHRRLATDMAVLLRRDD
jgi:2-polyprenyl-3-methyl-5-hydroxy-6-metoxy-1,4-benzoquinol methylase